jgi:hypothetical protein
MNIDRSYFLTDSFFSGRSSFSSDFVTKCISEKVLTGVQVTTKDASM